MAEKIKYVQLVDYPEKMVEMNEKFIALHLKQFLNLVTPNQVRAAMKKQPESVKGDTLYSLMHVEVGGNNGEKYGRQLLIHPDRSLFELYYTSYPDGSGRPTEESIIDINLNIPFQHPRHNKTSGLEFFAVHDDLPKIEEAIRHFWNVIES